MRCNDIMIKVQNRNEHNKQMDESIFTALTVRLPLCMAPVLGRILVVIKYFTLYFRTGLLSSSSVSGGKVLVAKFWLQNFFINFVATGLHSKCNMAFCCVAFEIINAGLFRGRLFQS